MMHVKDIKIGDTVFMQYFDFEKKEFGIIEFIVHHSTTYREERESYFNCFDYIIELKEKYPDDSNCPRVVKLTNSCQIDAQGNYKEVFTTEEEAIRDLISLLQKEVDRLSRFYSIDLERMLN